MSEAFKAMLEFRYSYFVDNNLDPEEFIDFYLQHFLFKIDNCPNCGSQDD